MKVREARLDDRASWDSFVNEEAGSFFHYFDWRYVYETRNLQSIPLIVEDSSSQLVGILPIVKEEKRLYSTLRSCTTGDLEAGGLLLRRSLAETDRESAVSAVLEYIDVKLSPGCSSIRLVDCSYSPGDEPGQVLIGCGYRCMYDGAARLPSTFVLELRQPFDESIWKGLWPHRLRQEINKSERSGLAVVDDREFEQLGLFTEMLAANCLRHGTRPPSRDEIETRVRVFRDRTKLFVALKDERPVVALLCHYSSDTCYLSRLGTWAKDGGGASKLCYKAAIRNACETGYRFVDFGPAFDASLAYFKETFRATRLPVGLYEKVLSRPRYFLEVSPRVARYLMQHKFYLWNQRARIWATLTGR